MYLVFTRISGKSYRTRFMSLLLCLCYIFRALLTPLCADWLDCEFEVFVVDADFNTSFFVLWWKFGVNKLLFIHRNHKLIK